jgi:hypothetical protein
MKKHTISMTISACAVFLNVASASANESAAEFFNNERNNWQTVHASPYSHGALSPDKRHVANMVSREAASRLGSQYVDIALKLTKLESNFRCHVLGPKTRHGRAVGPLQVLPSSARALGVHNMAGNCQAQVLAGILHMKQCIEVGAHSNANMSACHVAGVGGWNKKLNKRSELYKQKYIRMAALQRSPR